MGGASGTSAREEGNRTGLVEFVSGITPAGTTETFTLGYNGLSRLTGVSTTNAEAFTLDAASNLTSRTGPAATYPLDGANRPTSDGTRPFTWSSPGRLVARSVDLFGYDPLGRLTSSTVGAVSRSYAYSGDGLLQSATLLLTSTPYLWDPASSPARLLQVGSDQIVHGLSPLYAVSAAGTTTFAPDALGSVRAELNGAGVLTAFFRYRSYGEVAQTNSPLVTAPSYLGYAGELLGPAGLLYLRARWYDPQTGRFMTSDPVEGDPGRPVSLNAHMYGAANPARFTDPSGQCPWCIVAAIVAWQVIQAGLAASDAVSTYETVTDPDASTVDKFITGGLFLAGVVDPVGGGYSTAYRLGRRAFASTDRFLSHFEAQGARLGYNNAMSYLTGARRLFDGGKDVQSFRRAGMNDTMFFRESTQEFGIMTDEGVIHTYFRPDLPTYWADEVARWSR